MVRPIDPLSVMRRRDSVHGAKIRITADKDDSAEPQLEVRSAVPMGKTDGMKRFSVDETGQVQLFDASGNQLFKLNNAGNVEQQLRVVKTDPTDLTPLLYLADSAGNIRALFDHNGYPGGRRASFNEEWLGPNSTAVSGNPVSTSQAVGAMAQYGLSRWGFNSTSSGQFWADVSFNNFNFYSAPAASAYLDPTTTNAGKAELYTNSILQPQTFLTLVMEWEMGISVVGANSQTIVAGLFTTSSITGATQGLFFKKASTDTNWQAHAGNGGGNANTDMTVAPVAYTLQRFRLEYHGSASPIGVAAGSAVAKFWVNETLKSVTANLPPAGATSLRFGFGILNSAGLGGLQPMVVGPFSATWNRMLTPPAL
jgi:hypothetical protein